MWYNCKDYTTPPKIWWLIMFFALASIMGAQTLTDWGSIWAIVAGIVATGLAFVALSRCINGKRGLRELFEAYDPKTKREINSFIIHVSPNPQVLKLTLRMKASVNIQYIAISVVGSGQVPSIGKPYDYQFNEQYNENDIVIKDYPKNEKYPNGGWNLTFKRQPF